MRFLDGLDADLRGALLAQLRDLWTHTSTALEGNTLTLGETAFVLAEGITISGKPLEDHREVVGHARAGAPLLPEHPARAEFLAFCGECWQASRDLLAAARSTQARRG